jgi:hypothetical protein
VELAALLAGVFLLWLWALLWPDRPFTPRRDDPPAPVTLTVITTVMPEDAGRESPSPAGVLTPSPGGGAGT